MSKSTPGLGAFLISSLPRSFLWCQVLEVKIQQLDSAHQKLECLQALGREDFEAEKNFLISDLAFA